MNGKRKMYVSASSAASRLRRGRAEISTPHKDVPDTIDVSYRPQLLRITGLNSFELSISQN